MCFVLAGMKTLSYSSCNSFLFTLVDLSDRNLAEHCQKKMEMTQF